MSAALIAVDGGGSKTDLALVGSDGALLSHVRGPQSALHRLGVDGSLEVVAALLDRAAGEAGLELGNGPVAELAQLLMTGVDFPREERALRRAVEARGWSRRTIVDNDTFAVLRAGTERGWGVAVVCGSGINCVGVAPDGRHTRFPSLGAITGDWGGGTDVGFAALYAAARSEDGRGPRTSLERAVPAHFALDTPQALAEAIHRGEIPGRRVAELPPVVFMEAARDAVAAGIVDRLAGEVIALARVALERLDLVDEPAEVVLGGGMLQSSNGRLTATIEAGLREVGPSLLVKTAESHPIVGAVLLGLDELDAGDEARRRARQELGERMRRKGKAGTDG
jgi:N-acetylglucosamine kinase-like BadF-type ATPase